MTYWDLASFIALSLTGMFIMSFGSFFTWLLCTLMSVSHKAIIVPIVIGALIVYSATHFFWQAGIV